eukprot:11204057-Lingulodinium_polyedra.AAC.1
MAEQHLDDATRCGASTAMCSSISGAPTGMPPPHAPPATVSSGFELWRTSPAAPINARSKSCSTTAIRPAFFYRLFGRARLKTLAPC